MSWNDPKNDPWGRNGGDQGPPDLDDALRKFQDQFKKFFGGGGSGSSGGRKRGFLSPKLLLYAVGILAIIWFLLGWYQVDAQERGVVFRFGEVLPQVVGPGLKWNPPIVDQVEKVNVTQVRSSDHDSRMLTEDENIVHIKLVVQYVVEVPIKFLVEIKNPTESLRHATESALRHVVGSSTMDSVITEGRETLGVDIQERLQTYLDRYQTGIRVSKVNIDVVAPPAEVQDAFDDVQKAKEDEVKFTNEANAYAEQVVPEARGEAQKKIEEANAYRDQVIANAEGEANRFLKLLFEYKLAPKVTRERLYIDAMETVMSNTSKVIVDVEGGDNLLYLPLDKLQSQLQTTDDGDDRTPSVLGQVSDRLRSTNDSGRRTTRSVR